MLFKKIVIAVICTSLYQADCVNWNSTSQSSDNAHLDKSLFGNKSCIHTWSEVESTVQVKCGLKTTRELEQLISCPEIIKSLVVSWNQLKKIEDNAFHKYERLNSLNLSYNQIKIIQGNAFDGLGDLQILDLSFNNIASWNTEAIAHQTPSIAKINVTSNPLFYLEAKDFASLKNIEIKGVITYVLAYTRACMRCHLIKHENISKRLRYNRFDNDESTLRIGCYNSELSFGGNFADFKRLNFSIICSVVREGSHFCRNSRFGASHSNGQNFSVKTIDICLPGINKWAFPNIFLGLVAMAMSIVTMTTIFSRKSLRKNVSMFFIANLTMGDFLLGLWLMSVSTARLHLSSIEFHLLKKSLFCKVMFFVFLSSQAFSVLVAFFVTVERYLCIEFSSKPRLRLTRGIAQRLIIFVLFLVPVGGALVFGSDIKPGNDYSCLNLHFPNDKRIFLDYIGKFGVLLYILCYFLYARLFYVVRKSTLNVGIRREGRTAKRIIIVISTNIFFFLAPIIAGQLLYIFELFNHSDSFIFWNAVSLFFLGVNSCLNPFFYAFWNRRFRNELKKQLRCNSGRNVIGIQT